MHLKLAVFFLQCRYLQNFFYLFHGRIDLLSRENKKRLLPPNDSNVYQRQGEQWI